MNTPLLVTDVQKSFRHCPFLTECDLSVDLAAQAAPTGCCMKTCSAGEVAEQIDVSRG